MWEPSPGNVELNNPDRENCGYCEVVMNKSLVSVGYETFIFYFEIMASFHVLFL